jgi:hypothetical protein
MNKNWFLVVGLAILALTLSSKIPGCNTIPLVTPSGPDMVKAFSGADSTQASHDAEVLSTLCYALHDYLADDWKASKPFIENGVQVDNLRLIARKIRTKNKSFADTYPQLAPVLEEHFIRHVGTSGGPLNDETRRGWLEAFKQLAECSAYASKTL